MADWTGVDVSESTGRRLAPLPSGCTGCLCPPDLSAAAGLGELVVAGDGDGGLLIVRADARIAVDGRLLRDWHDALPSSISLECHGNPDHIGDVIRVETARQRAVYTIKRAADCANDIWEACWPD